MKFTNCVIIKIVLMLVSFGFFMNSTVNAQTSEGIRFNLKAGETINYRIDIAFTQDNIYESFSEVKSDDGHILIEGNIELYESISVLECDDDYSKIVCRYDSLMANLRSRTDDSATIISVEAGKDNIRITQNGSEVAGYIAGSASSGAGYDFYDKLLFIGEDIIMLVYPDGEIMNITENKILWEMAHELIGLTDEGFLEIIFPQGMTRNRRVSWEQSIAIDKLGDFKLKDKPEPLIMHYTAENKADSRIEFDGVLLLDMFETGVSVADLADEISLGIKDFKVAKKGSAVFSGRRGILQSMKYKTEKSGEITLLGTGLESYKTGLSVQFTSQVSYSLLEK